jgi:membrane-associated protein
MFITNILDTMTYTHFLLYNGSGGIVWVTLFLVAGYFFGSLSFVRENFTFVTLAIIVISVLSMVFEFVKKKREA